MAYAILNPNLDLVPAPDFFPVCPSFPCMRHFPPCASPQYASLDPRLCDIMRNGEWMTFSTPVFQPENVQPLRDIYTAKPLPSATVYPSYADIRGGNVLYYVPKDLETPYYAPVYQIPAKEEALFFQDPMGGQKMYYPRRPATMHNSFLSGYQQDRDEIFHREDLMALQSEKMHRNDSRRFFPYSHGI